MRPLFFLFFFLLSLESKAEQKNILEAHSFHFASLEQRYNIPKGLLTAISRVESGRYHEKHKRVMTWPWVIHAEGKGKFFSSKQEAIEAVQGLIDKGVKNIDLGLMQVNRLHHPKAFSNLEQAFDPQQNIEYAAKFLSGLKKELGSWSKAVAHYHSALPEHHIPYRNKVYKMWQEEQRHGLQSWIERSYEHKGEEKGTGMFRSSQFRIIRVKGGGRMPLKRNFVSKNRAIATPKSPLRLIKRVSAPLRASSQNLQNRFRFIKQQKNK